VASDLLLAFLSTHELFHLPFSVGPAEEGEAETGWLGSWQPAWPVMLLVYRNRRTKEIIFKCKALLTPTCKAERSWNCSLSQNH